MPIPPKKQLKKKTHINMRVKVATHKKIRIFAAQEGCGLDEAIERKFSDVQS